MPRQIDLFNNNFQVNHNPNNRLSFSSQQVTAMQNQLPNLIAQAEQEAITKILELIDQETGLDLVGLQQWLNELSASLSQSWLNLQTFLNGLVQETDADVSQAIAYLNGIGEAANSAWTQLQDFFATGDWSDLSTAMQDILQSIFGSSTQWGLVNLIPAPAVVNVTQNIQPVFDFPDAQSVSGGSQWSWDGTHDHTGVSGSGSAKVICNGVLQALRGIPGAVQPGQVVTATGWVMWSGLTYSGSNPIQLQLVPFSQSGSELIAGTPFEVAQLASPASSGSWTQLTGTYTVPSSGVAAVQLRLVVGGNATAGSVWWDDCEANLTGGFLADLQADSNNIIDSFAPGGTSAQFVTGVTNLLALVGLTPASVGGATNLTALWTNIVNDFINPLNALEISAVNGLASALSALLGTTTFQSLLDSVANALGHSGTGHTITNIETYLGLIPPANVTNVLGGANLGADVSSVSTTATNGSSWSTRLTNDLLILLDVFHVTYTSTQWNNAWSDLLSLFGIVNSTTTPTNPTPTIGPSITAAQATANTATTNAATAQSTANTAQSTLNTTNTNLFGSTTPGTAIITAAVPSGIAATKISNVLGGANLGVDVSSVHTTASNASSWSTRLTNDLLVLSDVFHLTYAAGSSGDAPGTIWSGGGTGNGKVTWYSCWNDLLALTGVVNSVTAPTDTAPTTGASITAAQASATTAGTNASIAISNNQATNDAIVTATSGTTVTGSTTSQVTTGLSNIPASNVVGVAPANVAFGAKGAGNMQTGSGTSLSVSETHTIATGDLGVVVVLTYEAFWNATWTSSVTYGGTAMTQIGSPLVSSHTTGGSSAFLEVWWLPAPASGAKTVSATVTQTAGSGSIIGVAIESLSYSGSKIKSITPNSGGGGTSLSMTQSSATGRMVVGAFAAIEVQTAGTNIVLSSYNQTSRYNQSGTGTAGGWGVVVGDAAGASSLTFSATSNNTLQGYVGYTVEISN